MSAAFDYFVVFADMRTGSNFLEASLSEYAGLTCHGELFNPHFIGRAGRTELAGTSLEARDADPFGLLRTLCDASPGLSGFRFFNDHDPRVLDAALANHRAAKILLTRNPLDSYISLKIARATGQWRLGAKAGAKTATVDFDADEFRSRLDILNKFQATLRHGLQKSGQTAFHISYDDLSDVDVVNGLARWLGAKEQKPKVSAKTKVQNPAPLSEKVRNFDQMTEALAGFDPFELFDSRESEPRRGSNIPLYIGGDEVPLLFMPMPGGPSESVSNWLEKLDTGTPEHSFNQKRLRQWMRRRAGHRSFTVLRHPLARAHFMFSTRILPVEDGTFLAIRNLLRDHHKMNVPDTTPGADWTRDLHHDAFLVFLEFLKGNLNGQSAARVDSGWASQAELLRGFAEFAPPDIILRDEHLQPGLDRLAADFAVNPVSIEREPADQPWPLDQIYSQTLESACRAAYPRDYLIFGWDNWSATN